MTRLELESKGIKIDEVDIYDNGNYEETDTFYLLSDKIYVVLDYDNSFSYHGKNSTEYVCNIADSYFCKDYLCYEHSMSEEGYEKLKLMLDK